MALNQSVSRAAVTGCKTGLCEEVDGRSVTQDNRGWRVLA